MCIGLGAFRLARGARVNPSAISPCERIGLALAAAGASVSDRVTVGLTAYTADFVDDRLPLASISSRCWRSSPTQTNTGASPATS